MELGHDNLAKIIDNERTDEQRKRDNLKILIKLAFDNSQEIREYLTLSNWLVLKMLYPSWIQKEKKFFEESKKARREEGKGQN